MLGIKYLDFSFRLFRFLCVGILDLKKRMPFPYGQKKER